MPRTVKGIPLLRDLMEARLVRKGFSARSKVSAASAYNPEKGARIIQKARRFSKVAQLFTALGYDAYLGMLDPAAGSSTLARLMFGRTVAATNATRSFPVSNPYAGASYHYHRIDKLTYEQYPPFSSILQDYDPSANPCYYYYIPVILLQSTPIEEIINTHCCPTIKPHIRIIRKAHENLAWLQIPFTYGNAVHDIVSAAGLVATPWEMAIYAAKINPMQPTTIPITPYILRDIARYLPKDIRELKESYLLKQLAAMAGNEQLATRLLAACLWSIIHGLPEVPVNPSIIGLIYAFLSIAITLRKNNYELFAFMAYAVVHEVSLLLHIAHEQGHNIVSYAQFKAETERNAISAFGVIQPGESSQYRLLAAPAISGAHAFTIGMKLAQRMKSAAGHAPTIKIVKPYYYEFSYLYESSYHTAMPVDIYVISAGPIMSGQGFSPGIDINVFIRRQLLQSAGGLTKPVTIVVDATTALYEDLKLDDDIKALVAQGNLSIIACESHQKFGLVHTDQAQYGRMFAILGNNGFSSQVVDDVEKKASEDLSSHLDLIIGAYINIQCGSDLELIKRQHFNNGALLQDFFRNLNMAISDVTSVVKREYTIANPDKLYFLSVPRYGELDSAVRLQLDDRNSFGHYSTTFSFLGGVTRIAPNASDTVDSLTQGAQLYFSSEFPVNQLVTFLAELILKVDKSMPSTVEDTILLALFQALITKHYYPTTLPEEFMFLYGLKYLATKSSAEMVGRHAYQALMRYFIMLKEAKSSDREQLLSAIHRLSTIEELTKFYLIASDYSAAHIREPYAPQWVRRAILALLGLGVWHTRIDELSVSIGSDSSPPKAARTFSDVDFDSYPLLCEVIVRLDKNKLLTKDVALTLVQGTKEANLLVSAMVHLLEANLLSADVMATLVQHGKINDALALVIITLANAKQLTLYHLLYFTIHTDECQKIANISPLSILTLCQLTAHQQNSHLKTLSPQEKKAHYRTIKENKPVLNLIFTSTAIDALLQVCHQSILGDFKDAYKAECRLPFFRSIGRSQLGKRVFSNALTSIEEAEEYIATHPRGSGARAMARLRR